MGGRLAYLRHALGLKGTLLAALVGGAEPLRDAETRLRLGTGTYAEGAGVVYNLGDPEHAVTIGSYCSIAPRVEFATGGNHRTDWVSTFPFRERLEGAAANDPHGSKGPIVVGSDVWIGRGATILSGVTIGHGAVVGAQAVVAKDVRPYALVVGNPAREARRRFTDAEVDALLNVAWWDWPTDEVFEIAHILNGGSVEDLLRYAVHRSGTSRLSVGATV